MQDWTARSRGGGDDFVNAINTRPVRSNVGRRWRPSKARSSGLRSRFFASSSRGLTNVGRRPLFVVPRIFLEPAYGCYFRRRGDVPRSSSSRCRTSYHPPDYDSGSTPTIVRARKICKPCIRVSVRLFSRLKQWRIAATRRFITPKHIQRIVKVLEQPLSLFEHLCSNGMSASNWEKRLLECRNGFIFRGKAYFGRLLFHAWWRSWKWEESVKLRDT